MYIFAITGAIIVWILAVPHAFRAMQNWFKDTYTPGDEKMYAFYAFLMWYFILTWKVLKVDKGLDHVQRWYTKPPRKNDRVSKGIIRKTPELCEGEYGVSEDRSFETD